MTGSDRFGQALPSIERGPPGPIARALAARLSEVESRNVTYLDRAWPVFWEEARGSNVRDVDGNVFLDLTGAFGVALAGHGHPAVVEAVRRQAGRLIHGMGDVHPPAVKVDLLARLADLAPWDDGKAVLASTGSEAVEIALKTAQLATGRPGILAFEGAYHGLTLGALSATSRPHFRAPFEERLYGGVAFAPFPDPVRHGAGAAERALGRVETLLARGAPNGEPIGAVIIEPVQGRAGVRVAPDGFMRRLSEVARAAGALVVADEILTGLGRCGAMLASTRVGLRPDVVCLGKALGGGMPLSACVAPARVMNAWPPSEGEAIHTSTFLGHPLACAAALAMLDVIEGEGVVERARRLGGRLAAELRETLAGGPHVADVRGLGLLLGIELDGGGRRGAPAIGGGARMATALLRDGVLVLPAGADAHVVELMPSVDLSDAQIAFALEALGRAAQEVTA